MDEGRDQVRRIKDLLDIVDVIGSYIELSKRGTRYVALCPFHAEKAPSFSVNREEQFFHCFGCKKSGDLFDFVMEVEGIAFPEALKILGEKCGIEVVTTRGRAKTAGKSFKTQLYRVLESACSYFEQNLATNPGTNARSYLSNRRFPPEFCKEFRLGFALDGWRGLLEDLTRKGIRQGDLERAGLIRQSRSGRVHDLFRNRLMIPIFDMQGRVVGFGGRVLDGSEPKYINSPETELFQKNRLLYGLNRARQAISLDRTVVIVEGYTDVLMAHYRDVSNTVAALGTALSQEHARLLRRMADRVVLLFDGDSAGAAAAQRGIEILLANDLDVTVVSLDKGSDPCDFFERHSASDFKERIVEQGKDFFDFTLSELEARFDLKSPGGRTQAARKLFSLVTAVGDPIKQDLVLHRIAERLGIRENLLRSEFFKGLRDQSRHRPARGEPGSSSQTSETSSQTSSQTSKTWSKAEEELLLGLLMQPALIDEFRETLAAARLEGVAETKILELLLEQKGRGSLQPKELLFELRNDDLARKRLISLLSEARSTEAKSLVAGALRFFDSQADEDRYRSLKELKKDVIKRADSSDADESLAELNRLLKEKNTNRQRGIVE